MTTDNGSDVLRALWQRQSNSSFSMEPDEIQKRLSRSQAKSRDVKIIVLYLVSWHRYLVCILAYLYYTGNHYASWLVADRSRDEFLGRSGLALQP